MYNFFENHLKNFSFQKLKLVIKYPEKNIFAILQS